MTTEPQLNPECIERHAVVSTGHVSRVTVAILDAGPPDPPMNCNPREHGWLVPAGASAELVYWFSGKWTVSRWQLRS